jgi:hypothetical protein
MAISVVEFANVLFTTLENCVTRKFVSDPAELLGRTSSSITLNVQKISTFVALRVVLAVEGAIDEGAIVGVVDVGLEEGIEDEGGVEGQDDDGVSEEGLAEGVFEEGVDDGLAESNFLLI